MAHPTGESNNDVPRLDFDRHPILQFCGSAITSDAEWLTYSEFEDLLCLTDTATDTLADARAGKNRLRQLAGLPRQAVFGRLAGYENVNDADRLHRDPLATDQPARGADHDRREGRHHGRHVTFEIAETAVRRQMFADILLLVARL